MNYAPSRYEFKSEQEFQTAMNEWCAENEPSEIYCPVKSIDHLDGGSMDDYRLAGYDRF